MVGLLVRCGHAGPLTYVLASLAFTLVAYFETVAEYANNSQNLREQEALELRRRLE